MTARLPVRLFASYVLVVAVGAATVFLVVRLLAPPLFDHSMRGTGMGGMGTRAGGGAHAAVVSAVNTALLVAVLASVAAGALVAAFVTRRLLRPLDAVRAATRRIAAGDYQASVPLPREPELAGLAADVNTLAGTLAATETRRTRLLGDVAHEMRTPLTALDGYVEAFIDKVFAPDAENLQAMAEELRRLHRLAEDLSALSRTQERRLDLRRVDADLAEIARRACERLRPQFIDAGLALTIQAPTAVPVCVDVDRITQVLTNLLGNALLATPAGGAVTVTVRADGDRAVAAVTDTGVGLAADDRERIFERFYRAPNGQRRSSGSGVGLTIARGLARAHGGDLQADSPGAGRGATFTLTLPARPPR
jgi:signal transduction histidine kinase